MSWSDYAMDYHDLVTPSLNVLDLVPDIRTPLMAMPSLPLRVQSVMMVGSTCRAAY